MTKFFKGLYTAQITPFKDGKLNIDAFEKMLERCKLKVEPNFSLNSKSKIRCKGTF